MVGKIVVVFYGLEGRFLAVETEVVDWHGRGEQGLQGGDHREAGTEDGDEGYGGWGGGGGGCGVGVAERGLVLGNEVNSTSIASCLRYCVWTIRL
jgi:hypothetical protein